jgi:DNA-binding protein H-NS
VSSELRDLQAQLRDVNRRLAEAKNSEKQAFLLTLEEQVALYGLTEEELLRAAGFRKLRKRAAAKYYDPSTGNKWSGRGPTPKWLEGKNPEHYLINRVAKAWWPGE